jgi:tetratricopeptide (TPR) repeat protein
LGTLYYDVGDKERALQCYEQAVRLAPENPVSLKNLADYYFVEEARVEEALKIYIQVLEADREDVECLSAAGTICMMLNKKEDARIFFKRVLDIEPMHSRARDSLKRLDAENDFLPGGHAAAMG